MHAEGLHFDQSGEDAYGRVTNPGRYQVVVDASRRLVDDLVAAYQVRPTPGDPTVDFPDFQGATADVVRLRPREGALLAFMFTKFPGVVVSAGEWFVEAFPACGCDACDESPTDLLERLDELVSAVVGGRCMEELTKRTLSLTFTGGWGSSSSEKRLQRGEWKRHGSLGRRQWSAWSRR